MQKNFTIVPGRLTKYKSKDRPHINLLLIQNTYTSKYVDNDFMQNDCEDTEIRYHYCWIKDLPKLVGSQLSKNKKKKYICDVCLNYFSNEKDLDSHAVICSKTNDCKISFSKEKIIKFKNYRYQQTAPFVVYCDFESMLIPFNENQKFTNTSRYQKHIPFSAGYYLVCSYDKKLSYFKSFRGENCMNWFCDELENLAKIIESKILDSKPREVSEPHRREAVTCHICGTAFEKADTIVYDHDHFQGHVRGFAHVKCNLGFKKSFMVPMVFHNLSGYDSHFIIKDLALRGPVTLLPINKEKYISFTKYDLETKIKFRFIDSYKFMNFKLEKLVAFLSKEDFHCTRQEFKHLEEKGLSLLLRKGIVPYDYIDSWEKLEESCGLPQKEQFYNKLNNENIDDQDYAHAQSVYNYFKIKNLGEYFDLYLKTDILLLADVFENFRKICHKTYGLDPAFYYTLPGYTWDCMMKYTKCELETIQDCDILMFLEQGIRGGISMCSNRYSCANNKYMKDYNSQMVSKFIMYFDANNLYGYGMSQCLPYGGFEWLEDLDNFDVKSIADDSPFGYFLEVDLIYPQKFHDLHKDLPFCCEHSIPPNSKMSKLVTTLYDKKKYILHYRNLKQCIDAGLVLSKIHRILKFKQSKWLEPYIQLNTKLRAQATNEFGKQTPKLLVNAVYGKTIENVRKHRIVKLVNSWEGRYAAKNLISSPSFHSRIKKNQHNFQ